MPPVSRAGPIPLRSAAARTCLAGVFFVSTGWFGGPPAAAQTRGLELDPATRTDLEAGAALLVEGQFSEARDRLQQAFERQPHPAVVFNYAVALRRTGEPVLAAELLEGLLAGRYGEVPGAARRAQLQTLLGEVLGEVSTLMIRVEGAPAAAVEVDGFPAGEVGPGATLRWRVDPGSHEVRARSQGREAAESIAVEPGEVSELSLALPVAARRGCRRACRWGVAITVIVALAAAATATAVLLQPDDPVTDPFFTDPIAGNPMVLRHR